MKKFFTFVAIPVVLLGCGHKDQDGSEKLAVEITEPHQGSSHFPGAVSFEAAARLPDGSDVAVDAVYTWEVRDETTLDLVAAFQGPTNSVSFAAIGNFVVSVEVVDPSGLNGAVAGSFRISNTVAEILTPDPFDVEPAGLTFDLEGVAETREPGNTLASLTFSAVDEQSGAVAFTQTLTPGPGLTIFTGTVTPSLVAGSYRLELVAATTTPDETANDQIPVLVNNPPVVSITTPIDGSSWLPGSSIDFNATVTDPEGAALTVEWQSSVAGSLGSQLSFSRNDLARAKHTIRLVATDDVGLTTTDEVSVYIQDPADPLFLQAGALPGGGDVRDVAFELAFDLLWVALDNAGAASVDASSGAVTTYGNPGGTTSDFASTAVLVDGRRLFGTRGDGVVVLEAGASPLFLATQDVAVEPVITSLGESLTTNEIWIGTDKGITRTDTSFANGVDFDAGIMDSEFFSIRVDTSGNPWVGTDGEGLLFLNGVTGAPTPIRESDGLAGDVVRSVHLAGDGSIWAATSDGLSRYAPAENPTMASWTTAEGLPGDDVRDVAVDLNGSVWVATGSGAARIDAVTGFTTVFRAPDLPNNNVNTITLDPTTGAVWFGCGASGGSGGLVRYNGL